MLGREERDEREKSHARMYAGVPRALSSRSHPPTSRRNGWRESGEEEEEGEEKKIRDSQDPRWTPLAQTRVRASYAEAASYGARRRLP